jgi:hypothetical protein
MNGVGYYDRFWNQIWSIELESGKMDRLTNGDFHCGEPHRLPMENGWLFPRIALGKRARYDQ